MASRTLRVAGGSAKGIPLATPRGNRLRPTTGQVREAIFNILGPSLEDQRVLDLYAGTGALGIEALSRGATSAVFVEKDPSAVEAILQSLSRTRFVTNGRVLRGRLPGALATVEGTFDTVFMDPPYTETSAAETLLGTAKLLSPGGIVVYEHASRYNPPERPAGLQLSEGRTYGDTGVAFYILEEGT